ncbi:sensor histidine kinase [Nocardioides pocheonensis]|uniref:histidine kinase n=1 Tax=Nocardioides pocheonensis TaxID=661485 RepID=A0A3N0GJM7_9ACTN|nr:sensor histidine kinase [Nocardioides pocheonensis]RNM12621.1 sensor histidine kinase [Nocardioides pocheonensis]
MATLAQVRSTGEDTSGHGPSLALAVVLTAEVAVVLGLPAAASGYADGWFWWIHAPVAALAFGTPAVLLLRQDRGSRIGWLLGVVALALVTADCFGAWAWLSTVGRPGSVPGGTGALWVASVLWLPAYFSLPTVVLLLAPDGRLPSPRWRPLLWFSLAAIAIATILNATAPYTTEPGEDTIIPGQLATSRNPFESVTVQQWFGWAPALLGVAVLLAVAGLVTRRRRAVGLERRQLDVVLCGAAATLALMIAGFAVPRPWFLLVVAVALTPYPVALGVAAARHQLWDLDVVVRRSVVYGVLAGAVVAAYVVAIVVLGGVLGRTTGAPLLATAVVAVGAAPLHARMQRAVDRRLFGDRSDPAAVLRRLAARPAVAAGPDAVLADLATEVGAGLRIPHARIVTATGHQGARGGGGGPETRIPLRHGGSVVGELVAASREPDRPLARRDEATLRELAGYVAVVVHNLELSADLHRAHERTVLAREEERRRLRRDLHDGLGPALAAIALQLETVRDLADGPETPAGALAETLRAQVRDVVSQVRRLVDDLRPAMLDDLGLAAALREQANRLSSPRMPIEVAVGPLPDLPAALDVAILRIVGEAMTNAARHSEARHCTVSVRAAEGLVELVVHDDGRGMRTATRDDGLGLSSMRARALELGGSCTVESAVGVGTTVRAFLPVSGERS